MDIIKTLFVAIAMLAAPAASHAVALLYADTNGDGITDTVTTGTSNGAPYVKIYHPNDGSSTYYNFGINLTYFEMVGATNTNGIAGQEVIVRTNASGGPAVSVIEDRIGTRRQYDFGIGLTSFGIISITSNTDGRAGNEIPVFLAANNNYAIRVIDDARGYTRQYDFGTGLTYIQVMRVTDTNGRGGAEIITRIEAGPYSRAFRLIDDTAQSYRQYDASGPNFNLYSVRNYDGIAGDEICYFLSSSFLLLTDRTQTTSWRANCN